MCFKRFLRWSARLWGLASVAVLLAFAFGGRERLPRGAAELSVFLLFPVGVMVGLIVAWWRELLGAAIASGCFVFLNFHAWGSGGRTIFNGYFLLLLAPAILHLASGWLHRRD